LWRRCGLAGGFRIFAAEDGLWRPYSGGGRLLPAIEEGAHGLRQTGVVPQAANDMTDRPKI
jgi:hypothetical protein